MIGRETGGNRNTCVSAERQSVEHSAWAPHVVCTLLQYAVAHPLTCLVSHPSFLPHQPSFSRPIHTPQDLTARARDSLVSFGERMSTRIFSSYLRQLGVPARQLDAPEVGFITSDDFGNADIIYDQTLPKVRLRGGC